MTKKESKEKRIQDIINAAITEFVEKGYENASMESIASAAGLTKGGLYYHFAGKDDILIKVNEKFMEPVIAIITGAMQKKSAAEGISFYIEEYLRYWTSHHRELAFIFITLTKALSDRKLWPLYKGYTSQVSGFLEGLYTKGVESGEFVNGSYRSVSISLMSAIDGILGYCVMDEECTLEMTLSSFIETFILPYKVKEE